MGKVDVWQGTLALMILKTVEALGPLHGYGIARRIEQTSGKKLVVNYGTLYPALLKLEQEGYLATEPMPNASVATASSVKPGFPRATRKACVRSCRRASMAGSPRRSR